MKRSQRLVIFLLICLAAFALVDQGFRRQEPSPIVVFLLAPLLVLGGLVLWLRGRRQ